MSSKYILPLILLTIGITVLAVGLVMDSNENARYHSAGLNPIGNSISVPGR